MPTESTKAVRTAQPPRLLLCFSQASPVASHDSAVVIKSSNIGLTVRQTPKRSYLLNLSLPIVNELSIVKFNEIKLLIFILKLQKIKQRARNMSSSLVCLAVFVNLYPLLPNSRDSSGHLHWGKRVGPDFQLSP